MYLLIALCLNHVLLDFCTVCKHLKNCFLKLQSPVLESTTLQLETGLLFICTSNERKENIVLHQIISTCTDFFLCFCFSFSANKNTSFSPWILKILKKAKEWNPNRPEALRNAVYLVTSTEVIFHLLTSVRKQI